MNEYFKKVIHSLLKYSNLSELDRECIDNAIEQCYHRGFSVQDAIAYVRLTEHYNPHLDEETACRKLGEISKKYKRK